MDIKAKIDELKEVLKISKKEHMVAEIEEDMQAVNFWSNRENAETKTAELKNLKSEIGKIKDIEEMAEIAGENEIKIIEDELEKLEVYTYFSGRYDNHNAIINFYAGAGGDDAQDWTEMLLRMYLKWAQNNNLNAKILSESHGGVAGIKSATLEIDGLYSYGKLKKESGVHRLVRQSPDRKSVV